MTAGVTPKQCLANVKCLVRHEVAHMRVNLADWRTGMR